MIEGPIRWLHSCGHKTGDWKAAIAWLWITSEPCLKCREKGR